MSQKTTFTSMASESATDAAPRVGIGMLGCAFMGKAHTNAYKKIPYMIYPPPAIPELVAICGLPADHPEGAARRYGYRQSYTAWEKLLSLPEVQVFDNCGPNGMHAQPTIAAAQAGKHVCCEKPLARNRDEAAAMLDAVKKAGVKHMCTFNYRFVPAVAQMKQLIDSGRLGRIYHYRANYLQEWVMPHYNLPLIWRLSKEASGSGVLGDLGAHIIDLARFLVGEIATVSALTKTFITERPLPDGSGTGKVDVDDAFASIVEFENGALGTIEASRFAAGRKNRAEIEINAEHGSLRFNLERLNELEVYWVGDEPASTQGFHNVLVTEGIHPWISNWWPHGHIIGWEHTFVHELCHFLDCVANDKSVAPAGATFEDGYRAAVLCDAILESAQKKKQVQVRY